MTLALYKPSPHYYGDTITIDCMCIKVSNIEALWRIPDDESLLILKNESGWRHLSIPQEEELKGAGINPSECTFWSVPPYDEDVLNEVTWGSYLNCYKDVYN